MISKSSSFVLTSQVFAVIVHSLARSLETSGEVDPQQILQVRMFVTLTLNSVYLSIRCPRELPLGHYDIRYLLILRTLAGICGSFGFYYSLQYLSLADATVLNLLAPLATGIFSSRRHACLKLSLALVCICGVGFVVKPSFLFRLVRHDIKDHYVQPASGIAFAMLGVIGGVCSYSVMPIIGRRAHPLAITNCFAAGTLVVSSINFAFVPGVSFHFNLGTSQWSLLVSIGRLSALMEYFLTAGLTSEKDGIAIYMLYTQVVLAMMVDIFIWNTVPDTGSLFGSFLIVATILVGERFNEMRSIMSDIETCNDTVRGQQNRVQTVDILEIQADINY